MAIVSVQNASAGMNLQFVSRGLLVESMYQHLNQERLKLAARRVRRTNVGPRHERANVRHHVSKGSEEYKPIDGLVKSSRRAKCDNDEDTSQQREDRAGPFYDTEKIEISFVQVGLLFGCVHSVDGIIRNRQRPFVWPGCFIRYQTTSEWCLL